MNIRVRFFAHMAAQAGTSFLTLQLPANSPLTALQPLLQQQFPKLSWPPATLLAVNQEYVPADHPLQDNDEVAIIPPVSGG